MRVGSAIVAVMGVLALGVQAGSSATSAVHSDAYFGRPEIVAREIQRYYSDLAYGPLSCVGFRDQIRCTFPGRAEGSLAGAEWRLMLLSGIHAYWAAGGDGSSTILAERYGLLDWKSAAPLHPTDGPGPDGARLGTYADGAWLPTWAKRFVQPAKAVRVFKAAIDSYPVASTRLPPGLTPVGPHHIKQSRARCWGGPKLIRCAASGRMLRTETGGGPPVPVTIRWRLTKYNLQSACVEIGVYSSVDAPYDKSTFTGPWKKGEWIDESNVLKLGGAYTNGSCVRPSALGLKQW